MIAGATAVQVGTANFVDPFIWTKLLDGLRDYMTRHGIARLADLVGTHRHARARDTAWISSSSRSTSTRAREALRARRLAARRRSAASRSAAACSPREGPVDRRATLVDARRPRVPRPEVSRHPEHRRQRGRGGDALGVWMVNVHASGGTRDDAGGARRRARDRGATGAAGAARHRRHGAHQHERGGARARSGVDAPVLDQVVRLAELAQAAGLDGVVASPQETAAIRDALRRRISRS